MKKLLASSLLVATIAAAQPAEAFSWGVGGYLSTRMNSEEMTTAASLLQQMGAGWTRQEFNYENIGGATGQNFGADDEAADKARAQGLKVLGLLNFSGDKPSAADWESFVGNVAQHFAAKVDAWEVINEPNDAAKPQHQFVPSTYNDYLARSHAKLKQFDGGDPVLGGVLASADINWLSELIGAGGCSYMDGVSIHPYRTDRPELVKFGEGNYSNYIGTISAMLRRNCPGKKVWLSELGYRTSQVGAANQANWLARSWLMARSVPEVDGVLTYNFRDDSSGDWGVTDGGFGKKTAYSRLASAFQNIGGKTFSDELVVVDRRQINDMGSADWEQKFNVNASANLATVAGADGQALQVQYNFHAGSSAVVLTKEIPVDGQPSGIGLLAYGDNSRALWRVRFKDAQGETFQAFLGNALSGWSYLQFDFSHTNAMTSWEGDGVIQYPISFNSLVLDRDGGSSSGTVKIDQLVAVHGPADLKAFRFGTTAAAWKAQGTATASVCGQTVSLSEEPAYLTVSASCGSNSVSGVAAPAPAPEPTTPPPAPAPEPTQEPAPAPEPQKTTTAPAPKPTTTAAPQVFDPQKSRVVPTKWFGFADGQDRIEFRLEAVDTNGQPMTVSAWALEGYRATSHYDPPNDSTTPAALTASTVGIDELQVKVAEHTLPQTVRVLWANPSLAALSSYDELPASVILSLDAGNPGAVSGEATGTYRLLDQEDPCAPRGVRAVFSGLSPVLVYAEINADGTLLPLSQQSDGSFGTTLPSACAVGTDVLVVSAIDASGSLVGELRGQLVTENALPSNTESVAEETGWPMWLVWALVGIAVLVAGLGVFITWEFRRHRLSLRSSTE